LPKHGRKGSPGYDQYTAFLNVPFDELFPQLKPRLFVKQLGSFRIHWPAITLEKLMDAPIAVANTPLTNVFDPELRLSLLAAL